MQFDNNQPDWRKEPNDTRYTPAHGKHVAPQSRKSIPSRRQADTGARTSLSSPQEVTRSYRQAPSGTVPQNYRQSPDGATRTQYRQAPRKTVPPQYRQAPSGAIPQNYRQVPKSTKTPTYRQTPYRSMPPQKKPKKLKKVVLIVLAVLLVLLLGIGTGLGLYLQKLNKHIGLDPDTSAALMSQLAKDTPVKAQRPFYMLLLGSDARNPNERSRSDVTTLVRVDSATGVVDLISIPRDTMVNIEGFGTQKINAAYAFGGPAGAVETVSDFAGVPISHYAEINFEKFVEFIDILGGVTVNVPEAINTAEVNIPAGEQTLSGQEALAFARERHTVKGGDFGRAQAQRIVTAAVIRQVMAVPAADLPKTIERLCSCVSTDLNVTDLLTLANQFKKADMKIYSAAAPSYAHNVDGISYVATMYDEWHEMMCRVDAGLDPHDTKAKIPREQLDNPALGQPTNAASPTDYKELAANAGLTTDDVSKPDK